MMPLDKVPKTTSVRMVGVCNCLDWEDKYEEMEYCGRGGEHCTYPGLEVSQLGAQIREHPAQLLGLLLGMHRLHILASGSSTELLDLETKEETAEHESRHSANSNTV